jgi:hypothetical protein
MTPNMPPAIMEGELFPPSPPKIGISRPIELEKPQNFMPVGSARMAVLMNRTDASVVDGSDSGSVPQATPLVEWSPFPGSSLIHSAKADNDGANYWVRRRRAKQRFRAIRKKNTADSWAAQMREHEQWKEKESHDDKRRAETQRLWNEQEFVKDVERKIKSKVLEREVGAANEEISRTHVPSPHVPKKVPMGYLFEGWEEIKSKPPDIQFLRQQMLEKRQIQADEKRREQDLEKRCADRSVELNKQTVAAARQAKFQNQAAVAMAYQQQIREREAVQIAPGKYTDDPNEAESILKIKEQKRNCILDHADRVAKAAIDMCATAQQRLQIDDQRTITQTTPARAHYSTSSNYSTGLPYWRNESSDEEDNF